MTRRAVGTAAALLLLGAASASPQSAPAPDRTPPQTEADEYTSYELLAPLSQQFRIRYDVTATTPGARVFFNPIRKGSQASDERVEDPATGAPLAFEVVAGSEARKSGLPEASLDTSYLRIALPRPVPRDGGVRLRIDKTYKDAGSYFQEGGGIVFARRLGIKRNQVVLPAGYDLVSCNTPSQVFSEPDGRVGVSFMNANPDPVSLRIEARRGSTGSGPGAPPRPPVAAPVPPPAPREPAPSLELSAHAPIPNRASQDREIVYFLQQPETHAFDLYHDYTEAREGVDRYLNVVRPGSRASNPSARNLDTGAALPVETLRGAAAREAAGEEMGAETGEDAEVVVIRFPAVRKGESVRLRISETYADPSRYGLVGDTLVWRRSFGRPRNAVVLPAGWALTASSIPGRVSTLPDGRVRLDFWNPRPDGIDVLLRARRR
jgi:hypothetical protein